MLIIRILLALLGFLLLRRLFSGGARPPRRDRKEADGGSESVSPFSDSDIQDAEYEEVDQRRRRGGSGT